MKRPDSGFLIETFLDMMGAERGAGANTCRPIAAT